MKLPSFPPLPRLRRSREASATPEPEDPSPSSRQREAAPPGGGPASGFAALRVPGFRLPAFRVPRTPPPLPLTTATIALLLVLPAVGLLRLPRPRAVGLEQLMATSSLLQSFPASPERPLPELWKQRFGTPLGERLWRQQRRPWWQFWGPHADGAPYLAVTAASFPGGSRASLPPNGLRVSDLVVVAPDPLSRKVLADALRPGQRRSRGLQRRCLARLEREQAVFWNPSALGVIVGPVAPLLQRFQEGCLTLGLEPRGLAWRGEAAAVDGVLAPTTADGDDQPPPGPDPGPLPADLLLELRGASLEQLLQGLLARQLIREPLAARYGVDENRIRVLRRAPFQLRLRRQPSGAFQASLELEVGAGRERRSWEPVLRQVARALGEQGFGEAPAPASRPADRATTAPSPTPESPTVPSLTTPPPTVPSAGTPSASAPLPSAPRTPLLRAPVNPALSATWSRGDGVVVGGWRWMPSRPEDARLLLFLGPPPRLSPLVATARFPAPAAGELELRARPAALDGMGLLPPEMPPVVRRSGELWLRSQQPAGAAAAEPISRVTGRLQVMR